MTLIKKLFILICVFFIIDYIVGLSLLQLSKISQIRYSRLYYETMNADVLFVGNSRAINSFYPPYFEKLSNLKSFNLSYNGLTLPLVKLFIDDYLTRNQPPKMIFIEVTCITDGYESLPNFKQYMFESSSLKQMLKEYYPEIYFTCKISKSYLFNSEYFLRTLYYLKKQDQLWINRYTIKEDFYNNINIKDNAYKLALIEKSMMDIFIKMIITYKKQGITLIPVLAPILDKCRDEESINTFINDFENKTQLKIVNLSNAINDISMFADTIHTNDHGAYLIAKKLNELVLLKKTKSSNREGTTKK